MPPPDLHPSASTPLDRLISTCRSRIVRVAATDVAPALAAGAVLIDIRSSRQRQTSGVVPGSIWYHRNVLEWRCEPGGAYQDPAVANAGGRVIVMCQHGFQSSLAAATLVDLGLERAGDLVDGFEGWVAAGGPVERYDPARDGLQGSDGASFREY
jgi:rhodanese-related sulfurtransferase